MRRLSFDDMSFIRNSPAWCPITGNQVGNNVPRIVEDFALEYITEATIYHEFSDSQGFTAYSTDGYTRPGETTHYYVDLANNLENISASPDRLSLGTSYEGRPIEGFRLGPSDRQHFLITNVVHGNEVDGLTGSFKAVEILMTHQDFAPLREQYTIMYMPNCNPDGHYNHTRGLSKTGPHPDGTTQLINLNRVWPWFWSDYTPSSSESKGSVILDSPEATAMYDYITTGNAGNPVPVRFLLDQHSTVGDGARYQSRDKCYREYDEYNWFDIWSDWIIWKYLRAMQAKRVQVDSTTPDLWVNYYRSRFRPHWHSWMSTRTSAENGGVPVISIVSEHNKVAYVDVTSDPETYKSSCNYNMDYVLASALVMQGGIVSPRTSVLIEHEIGDNQVNNSNWSQWQKKTSDVDPVEYRPGYWTPSRSTLEGFDRTNKHMDYHGQCFTLEPDLIIELPSGQNAGPNHYHDIQKSLDGDSKAILVSNIDSGGSAFHGWDQETTTGTLSQLFTDSSLSNSNEKRLAGSQLSKVAVLDLGNTGDNLKLITYESSASYARNLRVTYTNPRIGAATAYDGSDSTYIIGGDDTSSLVQTVLVADRSAHTIVELGTNLLPTADADSEAVYCSGGTLDGKIYVVGGRTTVSGQLRIVEIDPVTPSASETLLSVSGTTLPSSLIRHALEYNGSDSLIICGGEDPSDNSGHRGLWKLTWTGSTWSIQELSPISGVGDDPDPVDYSGRGYWNDIWYRWRAARLIAANEGSAQLVLLGGVQEDSQTGLKISQDYNSMYIYDVIDDIIHRPQNYTFGYLRFNTALSLGGAYDKISTSWSAKAENSATAAYIRINNAPGDSGAGVLTTRRIRTYYEHPPKWWKRNSCSVDLEIARPDRNEDEWRSYMRSYRNGEKVFFDSPMVQVDTLWPSSWSPKGLSRQAETATWSNSVDPRRFRVKAVWTPSASFLCLTSSLKLLSIDDGTRKVELWALSGDRTERAYRRDYTYSNAEQEIELRVYDNVGGHTSCKLPLYWGGMHKDVANDRFDSPVTFEIWGHVDYGHGFTINNSGTTGRNSLLGKFTASDWASDADISFVGGGWWSEPDLYAITRSWILSVKDPFVQGALLLGDRDPTYGQVDPKGAFRYIEQFNRVDDANLGSYWDIIQQTGAGFNILNNRAVCTEVGWERWDAQPNLRDCSIIGTVRVNDNNCRVGFFSRMSWGMASNGEVNGYLGSLYVDASGNPFLQIERFYINAGSQARSTLVSTACTYTTGVDTKLRFKVEGTVLTLETLSGSDVVVDTANASDSNIGLPDAFGICGETPSSSTSVEIDNVYAEPGSLFKTRITD